MSESVKGIDVSIIVPIYNADKYIEECIDSVLHIKKCTIEVLLIDNNSTDHSYAICEDYQKMDSRIRLYRQEKKGAAAARNLGIKNANGRYITFIDSDDFIDSAKYEEIILDTITQNLDMACFSFTYFRDSGEKLEWYEPSLEKYNRILSGREVAILFLTSDDIEGFGWNKIFCGQFLKDNGLLFDEEKTAYEDMLFSFKAITLARRIGLYKDKVYYYRQRIDSLVNSNIANGSCEYLDTIRKITDLAETIGMYNEGQEYCLVREIKLRYAKRKTNLSKSVSIMNKIELRRALSLIFHYQKNSKLKYIIKLLLVIKE